MRIQTVARMAAGGRLFAMAAVARLTAPLYRLSFLTSALESGLVSELAHGGADLDDIEQRLGTQPSAREALEEWLELGVRTSVLARRGRRFALRSRLARALARPENDDLRALLVEVVTLHHRLVMEVPERMRQGRPFMLADHDAELVARSSRVLEPVIAEALGRVVPRRGRVRLLEIGCGSGAHIRSAAALNAELSALGVELRPEVAERARENLAAWGLGDRVEVRTGDVRQLATEEKFDLVTLHSNIYYFPVSERRALLSQVRSFVVPGGKLLVTTACRSRSPSMVVLSLWGAITQGCGRLPEPAELCRDLEGAGFRNVSAKNLLAPVEQVYAFVATA